MLGNIALLLAGLGCLFFGGNWLVRGASNLALSFGVSVLIIALTFVAIGTSMPELLVSAQAALDGKSDLAIGNVLGSNVANVGLILGATGLIAPLSVKAVLLRREIPIMILFSVFTFVLTLDGEIGRVDGLLLLGGFVGFNGMYYALARKEQAAREQILADIDDEEEPEEKRRGLEFAYLLAGIVALAVGSRLMVDAAVDIARLMGVRELIIAITLVAFGTSLPELAASLAAAYHKETDMAIGNIVGSNIANVSLVLGVTALLSPIAVSGSEVHFEFIVMIVFGAALIPFAWRQRLGRWQSVVFLGAYLAFVIFSLASGGAGTLPQ